MKRIMVFAIIIFSLMFGTALADNSGPYEFTKGGVTVVGNGGTSVYILDGTGTRFNGATGLNLQFSGVSCAAGSYTSGATINAYWAVSNELPTSAATDYVIEQDKMLIGSKILNRIEWNPIVLNLNVQSGLTEIPYMFKPDPLGKYLLLRLQNGTVATFCKALLGTRESGFREPVPIRIKTIVYNMTSTTGTSSFGGGGDLTGTTTIPDGTRYLVCQNSATSGVTVLYSHGGETITNTTSTYIDAADRMVFSGDLQTLKNISIKALGTTYLAVECWTAKPY